MAKVQASNAMPDVLCYFCYDRLREPRILDCCHSFCTSCLSRAAKDGAVSCPTCTLSTTVPPTGITALPRNYILEELIEQAVPPDCDNCRTNPPAQAQLYCHQCTANFCHQCGMAVHAEKLFRSHQLVSISEKPSSRGADQMCLIHKTERLKLYCETCETVICSDCVFSPQHHEHITTYTLDAHESAKRELTALLKRSQLIAASLSSDMKLLDHNVQTSVGEHERISKLVNDAFDKVVASLNRRRNELLDVLDVALERRLIRLDSVRKTTQKFRGNVDDANLIASRTIERGDPIETLALKNRFARRVADFEGTDVSGRSRDPFEFAVQLQDVEAAAAASRRPAGLRSVEADGHDGAAAHGGGPGVQPPRGDPLARDEPGQGEVAEPRRLQDRERRGVERIRWHGRDVRGQQGRPLLHAGRAERVGLRRAPEDGAGLRNSLHAGLLPGRRPRRTPQLGPAGIPQRPRLGHALLAQERQDLLLETYLEHVARRGARRGVQPVPRAADGPERAGQLPLRQRFRGVRHGAGRRDPVAYGHRHRKVTPARPGGLS